MSHGTYREDSVAQVVTSSVPVDGHIDDKIFRQLRVIWQETLGIESVGFDQNYFDLGGDSSLAVQMFARIENIFRIKLPLATLYEAPTLDELAKVLRCEASVSRWSPLVEIQPNGSRPPFFCIHPHGGNVLVYRELANQLGPDQPFFGLQSRGLDGSEEPLSTIEEMAELYLKEVRTVQPHGPYFLGGYCMGGAVAYEMACQLKASGEEIALLALFDTMELSSFLPPSFLQMSYYNCQRLFFHVWNLFALNSRDRSRFVSEKLSSLRVRIPVWFAKRSRKKTAADATSFSQAEVLDRVWQANFRAYLAYTAKPFAGVVTDICPSRQYRLLDSPSLKWEHVALGGRKKVILPVNPPAILADPFVGHLSRALKQCIDDAIQSSVPSTSPLESVRA